MTYVERGQKELKTKWPITSGLTAETTKQEGRNEKLMPVYGSVVLRRNRVGFK